jgi:hypothetical protein
MRGPPTLVRRLCSHPSGRRMRARLSFPSLCQRPRVALCRAALGDIPNNSAASTYVCQSPIMPPVPGSDATSRGWPTRVAGSRFNHCLCSASPPSTGNPISEGDRLSGSFQREASRRQADANRDLAASRHSNLAGRKGGSATL